jgi:hypothetical protein
MGMIIGEHSRDNDLEVNVLKGKKLTNIRAAGKDEAVKLTPPMRMTLERALAWMSGRRAGRGDAEVDPSAQALSRPERAQAHRRMTGIAMRWLGSLAGCLMLLASPSRARTGIHAAHQLGRARPAGRVEQHDPDAAGAAAGV